MPCINISKLCDKLVVSTGVGYAGGLITIAIPQATYKNGDKVCIVVAQDIPAETIINSLVQIQIGAGTERYPLTNCDCSQVTGCQLSTRTKYSTKVVISGADASFRLLGRTHCCQNSNANATIDGEDA